MTAWDFVVDRAALARAEVREAPTPDPAALADGEVLLGIERFALTANNITYAVVGDRLGYWQFFPADDGWGRVPVWGFARVLASRAMGIDVGLRLYGYWPMSTHLVTRLAPAGAAIRDVSPHRAALPAAYNRYEAAPERAIDDQIALVRPLFTTAFMLDDLLAETAPDATPVLASASSRTAIGLAWMLRQRGRAAVALTGRRTLAMVEALGLYAQALAYDEIDALAVAGPAAFVDMAGDAAVRAAVHARLGDRLVLSTIVGATHHDAAPAGDAPLPGPRPSFFFAPDRLDKRRQDWGGAVLGARVEAAMAAFIADAGWLRIEHHHGPAALTPLYQAVLAGEARPDTGHIVLPR